MSKKETFVDVTEDLIEHITDYIDDYIDTIINALMPDGRPFGFEKQTQKEELMDYMKLRGNASAWWDWMATRVEYIMQKMDEVLTDEQKAQIKPWDIVYRYALNYSAKMERLYQREKDTFREFFNENIMPVPIDIDDAGRAISEYAMREMANGSSRS